MAEHVDIIRNDWFNGCQELAARATVNGHGLEVTSLDGNDWEEFLQRPMLHQASSEWVQADKDPYQFFSLLPETLDGSFVQASTPHPDDACPFAGAWSIAMERNTIPSRDHSARGR
jgi:hypothetical protein